MEILQNKLIVIQMFSNKFLILKNKIIPSMISYNEDRHKKLLEKQKKNDIFFIY